MRDILSYCESQAGWLRETIEGLVSVESPSLDKAAVDRCGAELASRLTAIGGRVERLSRATVGDLIRAEFGSGHRQVLLLGHFDTVWPEGQLARMPLRSADGLLYGPGTFDMKAGIAIGMLAARALANSNAALDGKVVMLWTTDEEVGSGESRATFETEARRSEAVLVLEPAMSDGGVKTGRKGCGDFELRIRGVSAHAGIEPGKGISAIRELAHQILRVEALQDLERGVSVNVGLVAGGTRTNVIPEEAHAHVDVRAPTLADAARLEAALLALTPVTAGTQIEVTGSISRPPLERNAGVARLFELARVVAAELGRELTEGSTGGGSDGNFTAAIGVPTLDGLGAVGDGAHALHEHVVLPELPWRAALVTGLIARLLKQVQ